MEKIINKKRIEIILCKDKIYTDSFERFIIHGLDVGYTGGTFTDKHKNKVGSWRIAPNGWFEKYFLSNFK